MKFIIIPVFLMFLCSVNTANALTMKEAEARGECTAFTLQSIVIAKAPEVWGYGEEFLVNYWTLRAKHLGKSLEEYVLYCKELVYMDESK